MLWMIEHFHNNVKELPGWECLCWRLGRELCYFSAACLDPDEDPHQTPEPAIDGKRFAVRIDNQLHLGSTNISTGDEDEVIPIVEGVTGSKVIQVKFDDGADGELTLDQFQEGRDLLVSYINGTDSFAVRDRNDAKYAQIVLDLWNRYKELAEEEGGSANEELAKAFAALNMWMAENFHYNVAPLPGWESISEDTESDCESRFIQYNQEYIGNLFQITAGVHCECAACDP